MDDSILIWMDLETTGFDPAQGEILEIAMKATTLNGQQVASPVHRVFKYQREDLLLKMDDVVLNMHLKSGLIPLIWASAANRDVDTVRANMRSWLEIGSWLNGLPGNLKNRYLAGNSIHFDRAWLAQHRGHLLKQVSHRMLDVSSVLIVRPDWREKDNTDVIHRAVPDMEQAFNTYMEKIYPALVNA